jgi:hypothetical protein
MKSPYSPLQLVAKNSYQQLISWHKVTGRIIITFLALHVFYFSSILVQMNMFWTSAQQPHIAVALISASIFVVVGISSTGLFRRWKYVWFYKIHVVGSAIVLPLLFFHVSHIRVYIFESAAVVAINFVLRVLSSCRVNADISAVPGSTNKRL